MSESDQPAETPDWELTGVDRRTTKNIVDTIARLGSMDRKTLAGLLGIGRSTLARAVSTLLDARVLVEVDTAPQGRGRPQALLSANPSIASAIGLDFGLRHIRGAIVDAAHNVLSTVEARVPMDYTPETASGVVESLVEELERAASGPVLGVGVALPGPVDRVTMSLTRSSILPDWAGVPVVREFADRIPYRVFADNESNLAAYAEKLWGAAVDADSMVYLKLHSGVGGALLMNEQIVRGQRGAAGEFGHLSRNARGKPCRCGNRGCLEASIGIPRLLARISRRHEREVSFDEAVRLVAAGDLVSRSVVGAAGREAGRALGTLANAFDPQCIVVGGALLTLGTELTRPLEDGYRASALPMHAELPIRSAQLGRFGSALGATALVLASGFNDLLAAELRKGRRRL